MQWEKSTAEHVNSYLKELRPLFIMGTIFGTHPLRWNHLSIKFQLLSWETTYFAVFNAVQLYVTFGYTFKGIQAVMEQTMTKALLLSSFLAGLFFNLLIPVMLVLKIRQFSEYIANWKLFQDELYSLLKSNHDALDLRISTFCRQIVAFVACFSIFMISFGIIYQGDSIAPSVDDVLHALGLIHIVFILTLWTLTCRAASSLSKTLLNEFKKLPRASKEVPQKELEQISIKFIILWFKIINMILLPLGNIFSGIFGVSILNYSVCILILMLQFGTIFITFENPIVSIFMITFCSGSIFIIWIILTKPESAKVKVNADLQEAIRVVKCINVSKKMQKRLIKSFSQLITSSRSVTLDGYITLNRQAMSTLTSALIMDLIVLIQLGIKQDNSYNSSEFFQIETLIKY